MQKKYRTCVGMMILNARNQILVGRRLDHPSGYWQMPQGGVNIAKNESLDDGKTRYTRKYSSSSRSKKNR